MRGVLRWAIVALVAAHGPIQLLGSPRDSAESTSSSSRSPLVSLPGSLGWWPRWSWSPRRRFWRHRRVRGGPRWRRAAVVSQAVIMTSWSDANLGTVVNVIMVVAAGYGYSTARGRTAVPRNDAMPRLRRAGPPPALAAGGGRCRRLVESAG
jgi:hypothetical protein